MIKLRIQGKSLTLEECDLELSRYINALETRQNLGIAYKRLKFAVQCQLQRQSEYLTLLDYFATHHIQDSNGHLAWKTKNKS
jgi:hypothetical protein